MSADQTAVKTSGRTRAASILLVGALSMFFAEVLSGSSVLWFLTPWGWLVTFWLYLAHTVLFVNLALRFRRTSFVSLYLWGVLFGLYESWITKVAWAGYLGSSPGWGSVLGFSFPEFLIIVLCWHPVFSWILPMLSYEVLGGRAGILPRHLPWLVRTRRTAALGLAVATTGALFLAVHAHGDPLAVVITIAGSAALIGLFHRLASTGGHPATIDSLVLGRRGMTILLAYLAVLYGLGFVLIAPERIAPPATILLTVGLYAIVLVLLRAAGPDAPPTRVAAGPLLSSRDLRRWLALLVLLGFLFAVALPVAYPLVVISYLALVVAGAVLFVRAVTLVAGAERGLTSRGLASPKRAGGPRISRGYGRAPR